MAPQDGPDPGLRELTVWLEQTGRSITSLQPLRGDVSARRYVRVQQADGETGIAALYPDSIKDACRRFLISTRLLQEANVQVPEVLEADCARGVMLLEDVGGETIYERAAREPQNVSSWFLQAVRVADDIAGVPVEAVRELNPPLDSTLLRSELERTWNVFARERTPARLAGPVHEMFDLLCSQLGQEDLRPCHRDFMVRNLVPRSATEIVVLDHQDLRLGPRFYDIASLLNDSLFPPPELVAAVLDDRIETGEEERLYHRTAAQRTLKAVGTYAAAAAAGHEQHIPLLQPTLRRALQHLRQIPEGLELSVQLESAWTTPTEANRTPREAVDEEA